jgi:hypothetical protein
MLTADGRRGSSMDPRFRRCILCGSPFGAVRTSSMRPDMYKVIVERPRRGKRMRPLAIHFRNNLDSPAHLCLRAAYDHRELNENLQPLRRYRHAQVGRPWDKVYSEICATIDRRNTVLQHIHQHIDQFIATRVGLRDGRLAFTLQASVWRLPPILRRATMAAWPSEPCDRYSQTLSSIDETWLRTAFSTSTALASIDFTKSGRFSNRRIDDDVIAERQCTPQATAIAESGHPMRGSRLQEPFRSIT